jgi:Spy/CpxP family protein refolding chaperone
MKKLSLVAALALGGLIACSTLATAQDSTNNVPKKGKRGFQTVEQQMQRYTDQLTLTDEQKPKVKAVLEESSKKRSEIMADTSLDRATIREKMQPIMDEQNKKMKAILTDDQFTKYKEMNQRGKKGGKKDEKKSE